MRTKPVLIIFAIIVLVAGFFYFQSGQVKPRGKVNKLGELNILISPIFNKFGLTGSNLTRKSIDDRRFGNIGYLSLFSEYSVSEKFSWKDFDAAMRRALSNSRFTVGRSEEIHRKPADYFIFTVNYGKFDILFLKIVRRKTSGKTTPALSPPPIQAPVTEPREVVIEKVFRNPKVAIVMDDFGYHINGLEKFFDIKEPLTIAVLPSQKYSSDVARLAKSKGLEVIMHLPLEAHRKDITEEFDTIHCSMTEYEVLSRLRRQVKKVPGLDGVNNHTGSLATEDRRLMAIVLKYLKAKKLFFLDSVTSEKSVCGEVARSLGVPYASRDIFLDNTNDVASIEKQMMALKNMAYKRGSVIAICHDRKNTIAVMSRMMPEFASEGIKFVRLSEMVKK